MKKSLQERLVIYLKARPNEKVAKGKLEELAKQKMGVIGETVGRRLRVLAEASEMSKSLAEYTSSEHKRAKELLGDNKIMVEHRNKNHCWYWYQPVGPQIERRVIIENGVAKEVYEEVTQ